MRASALQVGNLFLLLLSLGYLYAGRDLQLWWGDTPGGGFMPLLLGVSLAAIAFALLVNEARAGYPSSLPEFRARNPLALTAALAVCTYLLPIAGYGVACGVLTLACLRVHEPHSFKVSPKVG